MHRALPVIALLALAAAATACKNASEPDVNAMFVRVVTLGNSVTAGFQSLGINDSTQKQSFAALVAAQIGTGFRAPLLAKPGCPPPLTDLFTGATVGGPTAPICSLLIQPVPPTLTNVAVPGATVSDVYANRGTGASLVSQLTGLMLGGRTQVQAARETMPTFAIVWIGHNEILGAALSGDASSATDSTTFAALYAALVDSIATLNLQGAVLIGVFSVVRIPALSRGAAYFTARQQGGLPGSFTVSNTCAPAAAGGVGDAVLVPHGYGLGDLLKRAAAGQTVTLDCTADASVLSAAEVTTLSGLIAAYNAIISSRAQARGWMYIDPNPVLDSLRTAGEIPAFPNLPPSPLATTQPFGKWLSLDGAHPSALTHRLVADRLIDAINAKYGTRFTHVP